MIRAHLRRFIGGGLGGPLRNLPQGSVARAKPALEAEHSTVGRAIANPLFTAHVGVVHFRAPACRRNESWGEVSEGGRSPPPRIVGALGRALNVQRVRLARGRRAPPCSWTLLIALASVSRLKS